MPNRTGPCSDADFTGVRGGMQPGEHDRESNLATALPIPLRLSPSEKGDKVRRSFERKVELFELWAKEGIPENQYVPQSIREFTEWDDPLLRISPWRKPNLVSPTGKYSDLRIRYDLAFEVLRAKLTSSQSKAFKINDIKKQNVALAEQIVVVRAQYNKMRSALNREISKKHLGKEND
jgi:hypothetical protein